jgi:hypothetical protein
VFAASLCYAKITPAPLRRGDSSDRWREDTEAVGREPKFGLSDSLDVIAGATAGVLRKAWTIRS